MKRIKESILFILAGIFLLNCSTQIANVPGRRLTHDKEMATIRANYLNGLQHPNLGVVESSMMNVVKMKLVYPQEKCDKIQQKLSQIAMQGQNERLRYKAFLSGMCLQNPDCISKEIDFYSIHDDSVFYNLISREIANYLVSYKISHNEKL